MEKKNVHPDEETAVSHNINSRHAEAYLTTKNTVKHNVKFKNIGRFQP